MAKKINKTVSILLVAGLFMFVLMPEETTNNSSNEEMYQSAFSEE